MSLGAIVAGHQDTLISAEEDIQDYQDLSTDHYWQRIRFTFNLDKMNIRDLAREI